ncbi:hypothetical protein D3C71_1068230 [compost metagenome]
MANTARYAVEAISEPPRPRTAVGRIERTTVPISQNQEMISDVRKMRLSAVMSRITDAVERAMFHSTFTDGSAAFVEGMKRLAP